MGSVGVLIAALIGVGWDISQYWLNLSLAMFLIFIFMAGANALNDYFDRNIDDTNHPERPVPSKKISPRSALNFGGAALLISIVLGIFVNTTSFFIVCIAAILIVLYETNYKQKGLAGNIIISVLVALIFIFGGAVVSSFGLNVLLAGMAFFANLGREIVKDIEDIKGDVDRITLPKNIGIDSAANWASAFILIAVFISPFPYFHTEIPIILLDRVIGIQYLIVVAVADIIFINSIKVIKSNPKKASDLLKLGMLFALVAFIVVAVS